MWPGLTLWNISCKGGRLSKTAAGIGTLANIKPIIKLTPEGTVALAEKMPRTQKHDGANL